MSLDEQTEFQLARLGAKRSPKPLMVKIPKGESVPSDILEIIQFFSASLNKSMSVLRIPSGIPQIIEAFLPCGNKTIITEYNLRSDQWPSGLSPVVLLAGGDAVLVSSSGEYFYWDHEEPKAAFHSIGKSAWELLARIEINKSEPPRGSVRVLKSILPD